MKLLWRFATSRSALRKQLSFGMIQKYITPNKGGNANENQYGYYFSINYTGACFLCNYLIHQSEQLRNQPIKMSTVDRIRDIENEVTVDVCIILI